MNKVDVRQAVARLQEGSTQLKNFGHEYGRTDPVGDAALIRRFMNAERQEIIILRRWVLLAASKLSDLSNGIPVRDAAGLIDEMRAAATPKRKK